MTRNMTTLIEDAKSAGYTIETRGTETRIIKLVGRWKKERGLAIFGDGTAFDVSVPGSAAKGIRSYRDMRVVLGI